MASVNGERKVNARLDFVLKDIDSDRLHEQRRYIYQLWTKDLKSPPLIP
jgi:3-hydroxyacyl-[acyl-carrier-protein] dehydratase